MTTCMHCGKPLDEKNPSYLGLLLHKVCYQAVGGCTEDLHPRPPSKLDLPAVQALLPTLPPHHTHGDRETDLLAQKVNYQGSPTPLRFELPDQQIPLDTTDMGMSEILLRLGITKTRQPKSFYQYEFSRNGQVVFSGDLSGLWGWLREQKLIL